MEPRIQYAKTTDGVSIAYCAHGKGTPLVQIWNPLAHIRQQWEVPEFRAFYERLAGKRMLVQYDNRGTGLSQRDVSDFSLEALTRDTAAVVDRLELERFALWGNITMGPAAIAYAARHPERVSQLILWCSYARLRLSKFAAGSGVGPPYRQLGTVHRDVGALRLWMERG